MDTAGFAGPECGEEIPYNGRDEDCDGEDLTDVDGDGVDSVLAGGADCDDGDVGVSPTAEEQCADLVDNNCDGGTDEGCDVASAGPPDPGGFHWICGRDVGGGWVAVALALALLGRRRP